MGEDEDRREHRGRDAEEMKAVALSRDSGRDSFRAITDSIRSEIAYNRLA